MRDGGHPSPEQLIGGIGTRIIPAAVLGKTDILANTAWIVKAARAAAATIMHAPITFASGYNELGSHPYGILKGARSGYGKDTR